MISKTASVLFLTTYDPAHSKSFDNNALYFALIAKGSKAAYLSFRDDTINPQTLAAYTHIVFLTCALYNEQIDGFHAFLNDKIIPALQVNPKLRLLNPVDVVAWNSNKTYLKDLLAADFPVPCTTFVDARNSVSALHDALALRQSSEAVVVKPSVSASGVGTRLIKTPHALTADDQQFLREVVEQPKGSKILLQDFLSGIKEGEYSMVYIQGVFQYAVLKIPQEGEFLCHSEFGGSLRLLEQDEVPESALRVGSEVWTWLEKRFGGDLTYARIDGVTESDGRFVLMEVELIEPDLGLDLGETGRKGVAALCDAIMKVE